MSQTVQAGVARTNITPSVGQDNVGDYRRLVPAEGVGNELYAKALVLDDGENRAAIVTADVIGFPGTVVEDTRARIEKLTGIPGARVVLSASHTHSSPATTRYDCAAQEYLTELAKKVAGAVYMADRSKQEVRIGFGQGEARACINRWQKTPTGVKWGPNPDAPVDHTVSVLRVDDVDGKPLAILVNYACHPSIMGADNLLYSGDYTSYVQSVVEKVYDGEVAALFSTGAGGDIKIALLNEEGSQFRYGDLDDCRRFGTMIGAEAIKVAEGIETAAVNTLSAEAMVVDLPLVDLPSVEEVEQELVTVEREIAELRARGGRTAPTCERLAWAKATLKALKEGTAPTSIPSEVQLLRIGDEVAFLAVPGELFVEVGMRIKEAIGLPGAFVVAYANSYDIGYLPSKRAEQDGWCRHDSSFKSSLQPANFSGQIEDVLVEAARKLVSTDHSARRTSGGGR